VFLENQSDKTRIFPVDADEFSRLALMPVLFPN
jgi:hypothetical protein